MDYSQEVSHPLSDQKQGRRDQASADGQKCALCFRGWTDLGDDDVDLLDGQLDLLDLSSDDGNLVSESVRLDVLDRLLGNIRRVNRVHVLGPRTGGQEREDAGPAADVEDDGVLEEMRVGEDEESVRLGSGGV